MIDGLFNALANEERRHLLAALERRGLGDRRITVPDGSASDIVWGTSTVRLYHVHLPKLAEAGIVKWDRVERRIEKGPQFDDARRLLRVLADRQGRASADA